MEQPTQAEALPDIETVMAQVQVFASAWSLVGGRFDNGTCLAVAEQENEILADMIRRLFTKLESLRGSQQAERAVPTDAMVRAALKVQFPASYREHLHHPANGPKTSARTSKEIDMARRMIAAALAAAPVQQAAPAGDAKDAARYRYLRDGDWREREELEPVIRLQLNTLWDAKIDAAIASQQP